MLKVILNAPHPISPFNEPARDLRIQNHPLWLTQRNVLAPYTTRELELKQGQRLPPNREETIVYRDNLFFDEEYMRTFITLARERGRACRAAFSSEDPAFREHALPLSTSYTPAGQLYLAAVPQVAGSNLRISVQRAAGLEFTEGALNVQKAAQAGVYRKQLALTRRASGPSEVRVLITMGTEGASAHSFYSIPLEPGKISQNLDSVKQR